LYDDEMESKLRDYLLEKQALNNWQQDEMAEKLKVPKGTLSRWLSGTNEPKLNSLKLIAEGLGVPLQEVINVVEGKYKPLSSLEREALEIQNRYTKESIALAYEELFGQIQKHTPEKVLKLLKEKDVEEELTPLENETP